MIEESLPWYRSKVVVGAAVSILSKVLVMTGLVNDFAPEDGEQLSNLVVLVIGGIGDLVALVARVRQRFAPPITLT